MSMKFTYNVSWKGNDSTSKFIVPGWYKVDRNINRVPFKPRPLNTWRKQLNTTNPSKSAIGMPMDRPGGSIKLNSEECKPNAIDEYIIKNKTKCHIYKKATTLVNPSYNNSTAQYLRSRGISYSKQNNSNNVCEPVTKLNNQKFGIQGAVSSSTRLLRLKVDTEKSYNS